MKALQDEIQRLFWEVEALRVEGAGQATLSTKMKKSATVYLWRACSR